MKKKIFGVALIAAMAVAAGWNFNQSKNEVNLTDLTLANVEALARWESQVELQFISGDSGPCMNCPEMGATYCDCD